VAASVVHDTLHEPPPGEETQWSTRLMAERHGVGKDTVHRIWRARGIRPHLVERFKVSGDPDFEAKLIDVVGLYLDPPERAVVVCVDEKTQVQALDRTQPSLPLRPGRAATMTHDYKRNGTTNLYAALNTATGKVLTLCQRRHRHNEFLTFLAMVNGNVPRGLDVHVVVDNSSTHTHPNVKAWLAKHKRVHLHFTPTSSSWLNLVELWFRQISTKRLSRGVFKTLDDLIDAVDDWTDHWNE
jgi:transposase